MASRRAIAVHRRVVRSVADGTEESGVRKRTARGEVMFISLFFATAIDLVQKHYDRVESKRLLPLLTEVLRFPTIATDPDAHQQQRSWVKKTARDLGFNFRDAGKIAEIELPANVQPAPTLGLVVHGDVVPVDADAWSFPPFAGAVANGYVLGRGSVDDKGPLVRALLAMAALKNSAVRRTHNVLLLVGSDEESGSTDMTE